MKRLTCALLLCFALASNASAQWITKSYTLADGWNSIWLSGDASYATVGELMAAYPNIHQIWRWNPNPDQVTFTTSPSQPTMQSDEWTIWNRDDVNEQQLTRFLPNSAYLVYCQGATTLSLKLKPTPPAASWQVSGANFLGFPALASTPTFSKYFASFPSANTTVLSPTSRIYKYIGGPLNASNPMLVSPSVETLNPDAAYWFQASTVTDFTAPIEYELPSDAGLAFGRTLSTITVGVKNRSTTSMTITVSLESSEPAPAGQQGVTGGVALIRREYDSDTGAYTETPMTSGFSITIPPSGRTSLEFAVDRSALADSSEYAASILRIRDSAKITDVRLPVSAQAATPAGLWVAKTLVNGVVSNTPFALSDQVSRPFELIFLIHVDETGEARLLSQAFTGRLAAPGNPLGVAIDEESVLPHGSTDVEPARYFAPQLPLTRFLNGNGSVASDSTVSWQIVIPHDDATNPFVHQYHPDHDNLDASFSIGLPDGVESYTVTRSLAFTFTAEPPNGGTVSGWGASILGGTYQETLSGLSADPVNVRGIFQMRRLSEIEDIQLDPPSTTN